MIFHKLFLIYLADCILLFDEIATADVEKLLSDSSTKQCELDSEHR